MPSQSKGVDTHHRRIGVAETIRSTKQGVRIIIGDDVSGSGLLHDLMRKPWGFSALKDALVQTLPVLTCDLLPARIPMQVKNGTGQITYETVGTPLFHIGT